MPLRFNTCPHCGKRFTFRIEKNDIDSSQFPAPVYIVHKIESCGRLSTFYVDSLLQVSYTELEQKPGGIKTLEAK